MENGHLVAILLESYNLLENWHTFISPRVETHEIFFIPTSHNCPAQHDFQLLVNGAVADHFVVFYNPVIRVAVFELLYAIPDWQENMLWGFCPACSMLID